MKKVEVFRADGTFEVLLLKHKGVEKFSFVNITKGHICPCIFNSEKEALDDLEKYKSNGKIKSYKVLEQP